MSAWPIFLPSDGIYQPAFVLWRGGYAGVSGAVFFLFPPVVLRPRRFVIAQFYRAACAGRKIDSGPVDEWFDI